MRFSILPYRHHRRLISALLIPAFVLMMLFPMHYHLQHHDNQHDDVVASHGHNNLAGHILDIHSLKHLSTAAHHDDSHVIDSGTELSKPGTIKLPLFIIAIVLALLLPTIGRRGNCRLTLANASSTPPFRHNRPLLRAPPRIY